VRRWRLLLAAVAVLVAAALLLRGRDDSSYRVDAIFDTARGMVPGQLVKIAGAKVGELEEVHLTTGTKARLTLKIDRRFAPFRRDASCQILPEGFISENYVQCDPGTPTRGDLSAGSDSGGRPEVPLSRTSVPVQLQEVIDTFTMPVNERIRVVLSELGVMTAGRGEDLNAVIRRANPALVETRRAMRVVADQRAAVRTALSGTDRVLTALRGGEASLRRFVDRSASLVERTSSHSAQMRASVRRLPAMLDEVDRSLGAIAATSRELGPTARSLRASAPALRQLTSVLPRFATAADRGIRSLGRGVSSARPAVRAARPVIADLGRVAGAHPDTALLARQLTTNLRDSGGIEELFNSIYGLTTFSAAFDGVSHMVGVNVNASPECIANPSALGCTHRYDSPGGGRIPINDPTRKPERVVEFPQIGPGQPIATRRRATGAGLARDRRGARVPDALPADSARSLTTLMKALFR